ncbi:MAG: DUF3592 domain-containing protein [Pseudomonadota bacterium]
MINRAGVNTEFVNVPLIPLILLLVAGCALFREIRHAVVGYNSESWDRVSGVVEAIQFHRSSDSDGRDLFFPKIRYRYVYRGKRFSSQTVSFNDLSVGSYGEVMRPWTGVVAGSEIAVRVNPNNPRQSVLLPGYKASGYFVMALLAFVLAFILVEFRTEFGL